MLATELSEADTTDRALDARGARWLATVWLVGLALIALLAALSAVVVRAALPSGAGGELLDRVGEQRELAGRAGEVAGHVTGAGRGTAAPELRERLAELADALEAGHARLRTSEPGSALVERAREDVAVAFGPLRAAVVAAAAGDPSPGVPAAEADYQAALDRLATAARTTTAQHLERARSLETWLLLALLGALALEGGLLAVPVARRLRRRLDTQHAEHERERARSRTQLEQLARSDHLTGLANRTTFRDRLQHALYSAERAGDRVAVLFVDLDRFKQVNDHFGHDVGDQLLVAVAGRLRSSARKTDTVARLAGDEFTLILEDLESPDGAATVARKILDAVSEPFAVAGTEIRVSATIGVAVYPDDATGPDELLSASDSAMYEAKTAGRATFQFSTPELRASNRRRLELTSELRTAVDTGELRLVFQPEVDLARRRVVTLEALARWTRTDGTDVPATEFIRLAEDSDLVVPLGAWVLRTACREAAGWPHPDDEPAPAVAINVSTRQLRDPHFPRQLTEVLEETGLDPARLELEFGEDALSHDPAAVRATLRALAGTGVRLVIDDFGSGYFSLGDLGDLPLRALKLDPRFVTAVGAGESGRLARGVLALAGQLGVDVVAEGVEDRGQLDALLALGVRRAQGFLLSEPVPPTEVPAMLHRHRLAVL